MRKIFVSRFRSMTEAEFKSFADANPLRSVFSRWVKMASPGLITIS